MQAPVLHTIRSQHIWLSPERVAFWEEAGILLVADLHFGKTGHFRKSGIPVPQAVYQQDLQRLFHQISFFKPREIIIVGDMFHSRLNKEMDFFLKWRNDLSHIAFTLVEGNHDILSDDWYAKANIKCVPYLYLPPFGFIHDPADLAAAAIPLEAYLLYGHLHPGVLMRGMGKQSLRFPCFFMREQEAVLPAFSHFSGLAMVNAGKKDRVFAIVNQSIVSIQ